MKSGKKKKNRWSAAVALTLIITMLAGFPTLKARAASGTVYSCTVNRCYAHPVTGVIEDSGGEKSYATGQGMVEGTIYGNGILEVTDDGAYYLTIRMSLMDYTSGHGFQVQNVGDSGWSTPSEVGVTQNGTDSNGTTADICIRVPSENCVVRGTMHVNPMGRDVVFYLYPSDYSEGNQTDMKATIVTESGGEGVASEAGEGGSPSLQSGGTTAGGSLSAGGSALQSGGKTEKSTSSAPSGKKLESSIKKAAAPGGETPSSGTDNAVNSARGLSLSTETDEGGTKEAKAGSTSSGNHVFQIAMAVVVSGLILLGAVAGVIYFFRRNWQRWGGAKDDE